MALSSKPDHLYLQSEILELLQKLKASDYRFENETSIMVTIVNWAKNLTSIMVTIVNLANIVMSMFLSPAPWPNFLTPDKRNVGLSIQTCHQGRECGDEHSEAQCQDRPGGVVDHCDCVIQKSLHFR